ncbi:MAG: DUF1697 domain-containing protein [Pseudomonadota bacterium]
MARWVALLRGINVGGVNALPMADLRGLATGLGWDNPRTYVASGNMIFEAEGGAPELTANLTAALAARGLNVPVLILPQADLRAAYAACPYAPEDPRCVHAIFALTPFNIDRDRLAALLGDDEGFRVNGQVAYLHTPRGFSRSKLAEKLDGVLGTKTTARNLRSLTKLVQMLDG